VDDYANDDKGEKDDNGDDDKDDNGDDDKVDNGDDDKDDNGDDDEDDYDEYDYGHDDEDDYGHDDEDDYGHDYENYTGDDGDDVTPVAHTYSHGRGQLAATDLRTPRRHSVPHTAPDCLALTTVKQTFDVPHAPTIAELTAGIEARMSAHMDERIASFETGYSQRHGPGCASHTPTRRCSHYRPHLTYITSAHNCFTCA
jgi:hypothetical protein